MPLSKSKIRGRGIATTVVVELLILLTIVFAVVRYLEWSSDAALAEFMRSPEPSVSDPITAGKSFTPIQPLKGRAARDRKG